MIKVRRKKGVEPIVNITITGERNEHKYLDPAVEIFSLSAEEAVAALATKAFEQDEGPARVKEAENG